MKYAPNKTVNSRATSASFRTPCISEWCAQVTVTPEASKTAVFNKGMAKGFKGSIPTGGQQHPISGVGARLL